MFNLTTQLATVRLCAPVSYFPNMLLHLSTDPEELQTYPPVDVRRQQGQCDLPETNIK